MHARTLLLLLTGLAILGLTAPSVWAGAVYDISTGVADWEYEGTTSADPAPTDVAAAILTPHPAWTTIPGAYWIGPTSAHGSIGYLGYYTYELELTPAVAGTCVLAGSFSSDNLVYSLMLNGTELLPAPQTDIYSFKYTTAFGGATSSPIVLTAVIYNEGAVSPPDPDNPTGFILGGTATMVVPLPPAAGIGLILLAGLGLGTVVRRRLRRQ